jgi:membrane associated rhomboid family serine protease
MFRPLRGIAEGNKKMLLPVRIEFEIEKPALFTYVIIVSCAVVFLSIHYLPTSVLEMAYHDFGFVAERIELLSLFTSMFIHVGWLHIVGNMYFLWLFGRAIEQRGNRSLVALLYFSGGVAGAFLQAALTPEYLTDVPCIGASGAISGLLGAYLVLYPLEQVSCIYFSFTMRYATAISLSSIWVLGSWFIFQFANAIWLSPAAGENSVAYWAHIGGFLFGAGAAALFKYSAALVALLSRRSAALALEECSDLLHEGKTAEAKEKLKAALESQPSNPLILGELARLELGRNERSRARKLMRRSLKRAVEQKNHAAAVSAYFGLVAAKAKPPDNQRRLVIGRRFAHLKKYGHALGIMGDAFKPGAEMDGLDKLLYEIAELFAGPLKDSGRATAAFGLLINLFPGSPRSLDAKYRLRKIRAAGGV